MTGVVHQQLTGGGNFSTPLSLEQKTAFWTRLISDCRQRPLSRGCLSRPLLKRHPHRR